MRLLRHFLVTLAWIAGAVLVGAAVTLVGCFTGDWAKDHGSPLWVQLGAALAPLVLLASAVITFFTRDEA